MIFKQTYGNIDEAIKKQEELIEWFDDRLPWMTIIISVGVMFLYAGHIMLILCRICGHWIFLGEANTGQLSIKAKFTDGDRLVFGWNLIEVPSKNQNVQIKFVNRNDACHHIGQWPTSSS